MSGKLLVLYIYIYIYIYSSSPYWPEERGGVLVEVMKARQVSPDYTDTADTEEGDEDCSYYEVTPIIMKAQCEIGRASCRERV